MTADNLLLESEVRLAERSARRRRATLAHMAAAARSPAPDEKSLRMIPYRRDLRALLQPDERWVGRHSSTDLS
ncbi:hypothetical protein JM664_18445 [Rhodobacteraceae bacterium MCCB 386]|nr:hypothetical protein [Roseitranquillus sediminis]